MRESLLASDFDSLYELNSKKEREESEVRWDAARRDPQKRDALERFAAELRRSVEDVAAMTLRDLFAARNARQMSTPDAAATVASIEFRSAKELAPGPAFPDQRVRAGQARMDRSPGSAFRE